MSEEKNIFVRDLEAGEETDSPVYLTVAGEENIVLAVFVDSDTDEIIYWVEQCRKP